MWRRRPGLAWRHGAGASGAEALERLVIVVVVAELDGLARAPAISEFLQQRVGGGLVLRRGVVNSSWYRGACGDKR